MSNIQITWESVDSMVRDMAYNINSRSYDVIVGLARGGLIPAVMLSNITGIPMVSIRWSLRDGKIQDVHEIPRYKGSRILFVDDLVDSGVSFGLLQREIDRLGLDAKYAVMHHKASSTFRPDYASVWDMDDTWLVYPWEK